MATDFGTDVDATVDVPLRWALCSGFQNLGNALVRRLLFLREYVNAGLTSEAQSTLRSRIVDAVQADPRVQDIPSIRFGLNAQVQLLSVAMVIDTAEGPFPLVLGVTAVTVDILNNGIATAAQAVAASTLLTPTPGPAGTPGGPGPGGATGAKGDPGAGGSGAPLRFRYELSSSTGTEEVLDQVTVDFSKFSAGTLTLELAGRFASAAGTGTFRLYVGGNYDTVDGTLVITGMTTSTTFAQEGFSGTITNPTGLRAVKLTFQSSGAGVTAQSKDASLAITS